MNNPRDIFVDTTRVRRAAEYVERSLRVDIPISLDRVVRRRLELATNALRARTPRSIPTGARRRLVHAQDRWGWGMYRPGSGAVFNSRRGAKFLFTGAAAHVIEPKKKLALHFYDGGGNSVFAARVDHPGMTEDYVLVDTLLQQRDLAMSDMSIFGQEQAVRLGRTLRALGELP